MFIACALLPVAISIGVFYGWVNGALIEARESQLAQTAQSYSSALLERLALAEQALLSLNIDNAGTQSHPWFRTIAIREGDATARILHGASTQLPAAPDSPVVTAHLEAGNSTVVLQSGDQGNVAVWMMRRIAPGDRAVLAELMPVLLWGEAEDLPGLASACVFGSTRQALYCSAPALRAQAALIQPPQGHAPLGRASWTDGTERYRTSYREVFLPSHFRAQSWLVVVSQPESRALATAQAVARIFIPAIALGLLIALFLGVTHVRLTLGPLVALKAATRRLAAREFEARVPAAGNDEFTDLGHAFNDMSAQLGQQFDAMRVLAEIDGVILTKLNVTQIARLAVERIAQLVPAERCHLLVDESAGDARFTIFTSGIEGSGGSVALEAAICAQLLQARSGTHKEESQCRILTTDGAPLLSAQSQAFVLPIVLDEALAGLIVITQRDGAPLSADQIELLQRVGDRMAVAIGAARRDAELQRNANFDSLTQLPNRRAFMAELPREIERAAIDGTRLAVLFVDLDGFSNINDTFGHAVGDELLAKAAARLRQSVRKWDVVARLGGDEFAATLLELRDQREAATIAQHCVEVLSKPFELSTGTAFVGASIGIAMFPGDGANADALLQHADMAMYRAKDNGRAGYAFFEAEMDREAQSRMSMNVDLRRALERREFVLHYQPQRDLASGRLVGVEALVRWNHPTRGLLMPSEFIGVAEETGVIEGIGQWIIERASRQLVAWRKLGLPIEHVSVNVSPRQFRQRDFAALIERLVKSTRIDPHRLRLEITESVLLEGPETLTPTLNALQALGTPLELDDFGTGYSSLAYLQHLPVSTIKLDRSFVADIERNGGSRALVRAAIEMVHALGKKIVVEGVETPAQAAMLHEWGCDAIQGYLLSRPLSAEAYAELVLADRPQELVQAREPQE